MEIVQQLGQMFLEAVPTVIIILLFYLVLRFTFFGPLTRVMEERAARTEGARHEAEASQAAAKEKILAYEEALKKARSAVYAEQDTVRRALMEARAAQAREARNLAMERVKSEKDGIAKEVAAARAQLESTSPQLAAVIVGKLFNPPPDWPRPVPGAPSGAIR
jgi:F-type H+-transporting ATPase subunit b